jgi:hypothetical protein
MVVMDNNSMQPWIRQAHPDFIGTNFSLPFALSLSKGLKAEATKID